MGASQNKGVCNTIFLLQGRKWNPESMRYVAPRSEKVSESQIGFMQYVRSTSSITVVHVGQFSGLHALNPKP